MYYLKVNNRNEIYAIFDSKIHIHILFHSNGSGKLFERRKKKHLKYVLLKSRTKIHVDFFFLGRGESAENVPAVLDVD